MWEFFDPYFLALYKITGVATIDGLIGTFCLALLATIIGESTLFIGWRMNHKHLNKLDDDLRKYGDLSTKAMEYGDQASYKALNKKANDAYGQVFFNRFGLSAASIWPAFFALDWMQLHFGENGIRIPIYPSTVNYLLVFVFCYITARFAFGRLKKRLLRKE